MTTTNTRYVDPNAEAGGDGTTNALTGAHCAYKSLKIWEAARQANLVTGDIIEKVICSSDDAGATHLADTSRPVIDGWTTDATRYIQIEAASAHGGKWNDNIYRLTNNSDSGYPVLVNVTVPYVRWLGIQFSGSGQTYGAILLYVTGSANYNRVDKCIFRCTTTGGHDEGISAMSVGSGWVVRNCLFYGFDGDNSSYAIGFGYGATVQNCTIYGCYKGIRYCTSTNCGVAECTTAFESGSQTTCSSSTPTFADADNDDFHLASNDTTWKNQGTDLSATFTDDIDGQTRPTGSGTWDIGCDEYVATATAKPYYYYAQQ